ncbi:MAG: hypothetical protein NTW04_02160, partial [Elusimicrobia bacterium]|nr:hypothetical protein [Elusimicrobiota bacterium]
MPSKIMWKWITILGILLLSVWLLYPSVEWYTKTPEEKQKLEQARLRPKRILNLGLDLRGGTNLLLELDVAKLDKQETVQDAMAKAIEIIRNRIDQYGVGEVPITRQGERWISVQLPGISNPERAEELIGKTALLEFKLVNTSDEARKAIAKIEVLGTAFDAEGKVLPEVAKELPKGTNVFRGKEKG